MKVSKGPGLLLIIAVILQILCLSPIKSYGQLGIRPPAPPRTVELFDVPELGLETYVTDSTFFAKKPKAFKRTVEMDSTARYVSFREAIDGTEYNLPAVVDLETYAALRIQADVRELWKKSVTTGIKGQVSKAFGAIKLDIPFKIKSKTFTRIFGSDRISLNVTGNISFDLSGRTEKRSGSAINAQENQNTFSPRFNQTQQFTVEGKIGEKVTVSVQQNSEAVMDIENTLRLRYDGDEDEIVKKIEAGNISLSLPSTKYVIFGGSNKGLFGLKSEMQVGNLYVTSIASLEKGQQQELSISGSSSESKTTIWDRDFIKNKYFFLDLSYREQYEEGYRGNQAFVYQAGTDIIQLDVFKSTSLSDGQGRSAIVVLDPAGDYQNVAPDTIETVDGQSDKGVFKPLDENEYEYDRYRGYIKLNQPIGENEILAVAYTTSDGIQVGSQLSDTSGTKILKLIKPQNMQPTSTYKETWPLMMRNVYSLGGTDIEADGFDIRLQYNKTGQEQTHQDVDPQESFLNLVGLDVLDTDGNPVEGGDNKVDNNSNLINRADGILMFPALEPFNPGENAPFQDLADKYRVGMYNISHSNRTAFQDSSKFEMIVTSKSTKSTFDLGFYVLEGSEVVTLNGRTLQRDRDYVIDYFSGQLTLMSDEAMRSSSNIEVKYERANLFQLDKKTILGGRMEYRFLDDSFIGFTALYLNKSTIERRVRVGQEPFRNFVWDLNASFKFKPHFLTKMVDALPLVETSDESRFSIEGEFAQVLPNPNTLSNESTGDDDGVAYIDDFESSKRTTTLGIRYKTWTKSSAPTVLPNLLPFHDQNDDLSAYKIADTEASKSRANLVWFNPYKQVWINDIWPNRDVNAQTGQTTDVLGLEYWRDEGTDPDSAWAGMMRSTTSFADQQKTKYIELWIQGWKGTINIDIGRISEDWHLDGQNYLGEDSRRGLNTEDINENGLLDDGEDLGIDGVPGSDDPLDIWSEPQRGATDRFDGVLYDGINGTEGNGNARGARYPDTEDLNGNSKIDVFNNYFEYSFSLDSTDQETRKWIVGSTEKGWRQFRIPLKDFSRKIGDPDTLFQQVYFTRLWVSDIPEERTRILIATFDFVGNEWEEEGISLTDSTGFFKNDSIFTLATYNTEENTVAIPGGPEPYTSPPGVSGVRDRITQAISKEQSLVMIFNDLPSGARAEAKKSLFQNMEMVNYKRLRMFVHGDRSLPIEPLDGDSSNVQFYLRFGSDDRNYYEFSQDIYRGWNTLNEIDIDLDAMSEAKFLPLDSLDQGGRVLELDDVPGGYYRVVGEPSLKTIRYFTIGVINNDQINPFTGEVWLDEMRLSGVRRESATALRLKTELKLADLLRFNAEWESKDADFHNISTQFGGGNTEERQNYSGAFYVDKFLPDSWDISFPIDARASFSRSIPKYLPKTDILSGYRNNSIDRKMKSLLGLRKVPDELKDQISYNEVMGVGTTIKKRGKSKRWYLRYTIDQFSVNLDYSRKHSTSWDLKFNDSEQYKESFKYQIPFGSDNYIKPLGFAKKIPVLNKLSDQRLSYLPNSVNMSLNISDSETSQLRRAEGSTLKRQANTSASRSISTSYKMLNNLSFSYSRNYQSDVDADSLKHEDLFREILTKGNFGLDTDINQSFKGDFKPDLLKWLRTDFSFSSNFRYSLTNNYQYQGASSKIQKRVSLTLNPNTLINSIWSPKSKKSSATTSRRRGTRRRSQITQDKTSEEEKKEGEEEEDEEGKSKRPQVKIPNPFILLYNMLDSWQSIQSTYSVSDNVTNQYLSDIPKWDYQFGFTKNPGVPQDSALQNVQLQGPSLSQTSNLRTTTSLKITENIKTSFNHDIGKTETSTDFNRTRSGSNTVTFFALGEDPLKDYKGFGTDIRQYIPDWSVQISGVEKFLFFPTFAKSVTVDHGHSGKYTEKKSLQVNEGFVPTAQTFSNNWSPLIGFNIRTIWGVSSTIRMTNSTNYSYAKGGGATRTENKAMTISMNYSKTAGFKIPLPVWPFKGKSFKNEINFSLSYDSSENGTYQRKFNEEKFNEKQKNSSWKLRPSATYRFNTRVQGSMFYEMGATKNKISGEYGWTEFGITVNIAIRD